MKTTEVVIRARDRKTGLTVGELLDALDRQRRRGMPEAAPIRVRTMVGTTPSGSLVKSVAVSW